VIGGHAQALKEPRPLSVLHAASDGIVVELPRSPCEILYSSFCILIVRSLNEHSLENLPFFPDIVF
jgi:hypothetical protein